MASYGYRGELGKYIRPLKHAPICYSLLENYLILDLKMYSLHACIVLVKQALKNTNTRLLFDVT